jgi:hypothetical protein
MQEIFDWIGERLIDFISLLPDSPFMGGVDLPRGVWLNWLNWFVPVGEILATLVVFLILMPVLMGVQWILRYIGAIN